ncbi:hypothetical protein DOTSEDRAFT_70142 [Dothistroma septosporum NZE10]|uniref:Uncharacterized protein n=1 Tax=Dothistroma septosporum (strain NZE10 / CBS 128990) TaxID=675120 RepID=N1PUG7_DOTSN|nr:hypothetical protein DOTSEDRAFT_70142 [Dothistroma septosporum NZE10]
MSSCWKDTTSALEPYRSEIWSAIECNLMSSGIARARPSIHDLYRMVGSHDIESISSRSVPKNAPRCDGSPRDARPIIHCPRRHVQCR